MCKARAQPQGRTSKRCREDSGKAELISEDEDSGTESKEPDDSGTESSSKEPPPKKKKPAKATKTPAPAPTSTKGGTATGDSTDSADDSERMAFGNGTKLHMKMENDKGVFQKCAEVHAIDDEVEFPVELYDAKVLVRFAARSVQLCQSSYCLFTLVGPRRQEASARRLCPCNYGQGAQRLD